MQMGKDTSSFTRASTPVTYKCGHVLMLPADMSSRDTAKQARIVAADMQRLTAVIHCASCTQRIMNNVNK